MDSNYETRIYIDESCHLATNDGFMVLGAVWGTAESLADLHLRVKLLKRKYGLPTRREVKWTKVSPKMLDYYKELVDAFMDSEGTNYRAVIIDKDGVDNKTFCQTDDDFYYKMLYLVVRTIAEKQCCGFRLFVDYKDTRSDTRSKKLAEVLGNTGALTGRDFIAQPIRSYESTPLQIADFINGIVMYSKKPKGAQDSAAKLKIVEYLKKKTGLTLNEDTPRFESKFNLLFWKSRINL
jgi:hypothetical protein